MNPWLQQIDLVYAVYGAAFMTMGVLAGTLKEDNRHRLAWPWLQAFGILHGLHEWIEGFAVALSPSTPLALIRLFLLYSSFVALLEFARRSHAPGRLRPGVWIHPLLLGLASLGLLHHWVGLDIGARYALALPAALFSGNAFRLAARAGEPGERFLRAGALLFALYGLLGGLVTPAAPFWPARSLNAGFFLDATGAPIQLFRTLTAVALAGCIWGVAQQTLNLAERRTENRPQLRLWQTMLALVVALALGAGITLLLGTQADRKIRADLLTRARAIAVVLDASALDRLSGEPDQEWSPPHRAAVRTLSNIQRMSPDVGQAYLYARRNNDLIIYASSMSDKPEHYIPPGTVYEGELTPQDLDFFNHGTPYVAGPFHDRWGEWVSAMAPVLQREEGGPVDLALGLDISADTLRHAVRLQRLPGLLITVGFALAVLDWFARKRRYWITTRQLADSAMRLRALSADLEQRVRLRTAELENTNRALQQEVSAHLAAEMKFRTLADQLPVITYTVTLHPSPHTTFISAQVQHLLGYTPEEWLADPELWMRVIHPDDRARVLGEIQRHNRTGEAFDLEFRQLTRAGAVRWFRNTARFQYDGNHAHTFVHGVMLDITDRVLAAQELREIGERYRLLFEHAPVGVFHYDRNMTLTRSNPRFAAILGSSEAKLVGLNLRALRDPSVQPALEDALGGKRGAYEGHYHSTTSDKEVWISMQTAPILDDQGQLAGAVGIVEDISERKRIEEERSKSQKLESIGLLAGGIAHDFNNILTSILGNISMLRIGRAEADEENRAILAEAERATKRAKELTQQLLTFAKGGAPVRTLTHLGDILRQTASFSLHGSASRCEPDLPADLWPAEVDSGQVTQLIQNLLINADQATPGGGLITLRAANVRLAAHEVHDLPPGPYVRIEVEDAGAGIPPQHLARIFDPYFTTKPKGTGLGLTSSFSIARKHGGYLAVRSEPGRGSCFTTYLPARDHIAPESKPVPQPRPASASGRLLILDDEPSICDLMRRILSRAGFTVEVAAEGKQALALFRQAREEGRPFCGAILDLTIPGGMGGRETFLRMREIDPALCALVASGYSEQTLEECRTLGFSGIVPKPFTAQELTRIVTATLATCQQRA